MSLITQLRHERAAINDQLQALGRIEAEGGTLSAEQLAEFETLEARFNGLSDKLARAEANERRNAQTAVPVEEGAQGNKGSPRIEGPFAAELPKGARMAQMVRALAAAGGNQQHAAQLAGDYGMSADVAMALSTVTPGAGGVLVPTNFSAEVIELLRPKSVVRRLGTVSLPLNNGNLTIPRIKGGAVVQYIGTEEDIPVTSMSFEDLKLSSKKLAGLVPISNDLLAYSGTNPNVDRLVVSDLTVAIGLTEDLHFIRGAGTGNLPKGLRFWAPAFNVITAPAATDRDTVELALSSLILRLENGNANMVAPAFIMAPRTKRWLAALRDGNGNFIYPSLENNLLKGFPVATTTQIPINLGDNGDESEIHFTDLPTALSVKTTTW